jgi:BirA family biotin operon repressor/biotin-[acetyl-CoA-carboxylase] ligase
MNVNGKKRARRGVDNPDTKIISVLRDSNGFVSGQKMSNILGITRAGVWKRIKSLRESGYRIDAVPSKGYRMSEAPDIPTRHELMSVYNGTIIGREVLYYPCIDSTNNRAMEIGTEMPEGTVIVADYQEHGRGRFGRRWVSPKGVNLYFTVILKPLFPPRDASIITLMTAVAVAQAISKDTNLNACIKWPNDIIVQGRKVGGILTEMKSNMDSIEFVAVGIGVNVNMPVNMLPEDIRQVSGSLSMFSGRSINRVKLMGAIMKEIEYWYSLLLRGERDVLLEQWRQMDITTGRSVEVKMYEKVISGTAVGVNEKGELLLRLGSGIIKEISAGEVTLL